MTNVILVSLVAFTLLQANPVTPPAQQPCAPGRTPAPEQMAGRREGVRLARMVNTRQASQPGARERKYLTQQELAIASVPGWELRLDLTPSGYWFMVSDKSDPCGFAFVSNQDGVIFEARPIR